MTRSVPNRTIAGMRTNQPRIPPANIYAEIFGPQIYPTEIRAGYISEENSVLSAESLKVTTDLTAQRPSVTNLITAPIAIPINTDFAEDPPFSPARRTSAQAVPSG